MSPPIQTLATTEDTEETEAQHVPLREGRELVLSEDGGHQLVEIRSESGQLELRIQLTEAGPVLQMDAVRMQLRASEAVAIESKQVSVTATEELALAGKAITVEAESDLNITAGSDLRMVGTMIYLN